MTAIKAKGIGGIHNEKPLTMLRFCAWVHVTLAHIRQKLVKSPSKNPKILKY